MRTKQTARLRTPARRAPPPGARARLICSRTIRLTERWTLSRSELWTLLLGRHARLGAESVCAGAAGVDAIWQLVGAYALVPIDEVRDGSLRCVPCITPHPLFGVAVTDCGRVYSLAGIRILTIGGMLSEETVDEEAINGVLALVAEHCRDLRALCYDGPGGDGETDLSEAMGQVFDRCSKLEVLYAVDCQFVPQMTPGRIYALTHLHLSCFIYGGPEPSDVSAWLRQMPRLRHFGITCCAEVDGSELLQAVTADIAPSLASLDLSETGADESWEDDEARVRRILAALPRGLSLTPPGNDDYDAEDFLRGFLREHFFNHPALPQICSQDDFNPSLPRTAPYFWRFPTETRQFERR